MKLKKKNLYIKFINYVINQDYWTISESDLIYFINLYYNIEFKNLKQYNFIEFFIDNNKLFYKSNNCKDITLYFLNKIVNKINKQPDLLTNLKKPSLYIYNQVI